MKHVIRKHQTGLGGVPTGAVDVGTINVGPATIANYVTERRLDAPLPNRPFTIIHALLAAKGELWHEQAVLSLEGVWVSLHTLAPLDQEAVVEFYVISEALSDDAWQLINERWTRDRTTAVWTKRDDVGKM